MKQKDLKKSMRITLDNARRFYEDSKILGQNGSFGHATGLAVLGFEEAHKAYLLSQHLSIFDGIYTEEYREELNHKLTDHSWKQSYAKEFRVGLEFLIASMNNEEQKELGLTSYEDLKDGTQIAFLENLNDLKNDGFYSNPFASPIWNPSKTKKKTLNSVLKLLRTHISSVEKTVHWLSWLSALPSILTKSAREQIVQIWASLNDAKNLGDLQDKLTEFDEIGDQIFKLAMAAYTDERIMDVRKERKKLRRYGKKTG